VIIALRVPRVAGVNVIVTVAEPPGATMPEGGLIVNSAELLLLAVNVSVEVAAAALRTVIVSVVVLVAPTCCEPNCVPLIDVVIVAAWAAAPSHQVTSTARKIRPMSPS
jgi:hypothetical protein